MATDATGFYVEGVLVLGGGCTEPLRISSSLAHPPQIAILFVDARYEVVWTAGDGVAMRTLDEDGMLGNETRLTDESLDTQSSLQWLRAGAGRVLAREAIVVPGADGVPVVTGRVTMFDEGLRPVDLLELMFHRVAIAAHRETVAVVAQPDDQNPPVVRLYRASTVLTPFGEPALLNGRFGYASISATPTSFFVALWQRGIPEQVAIAKLDHDGRVVVPPRLVGEGLYPEIASGPAGTMVVFGERSTLARAAGYCAPALAAALLDEDTLTLSPPVVVSSERGEYRDFEVRASPTGFQVGADFVVWYRDGNRDFTACLAPRFVALDSRGDVLFASTPSSALAAARE